jgi:chemotaxis response regulator CheB
VAVLLVETTGLLRDIIKEFIDREPDIRVVGELREYSLLPQMLDDVIVDVVVLGLHNQAISSMCMELVARHRSLRCLAVDAQGRRGVLYELRPQQIDLGELSADLVLHVLRGTA